MATYLIINTAFIVAVLVLFRIKLRRPSASWWIALVILLVMTAVFDSLIVGLDIVAYNPDKILRVYIGNAPVEDFFYALLAMILVPAIWRRLGDDGTN